MVAIGMALIWAGYTTGLYGWLLINGYDVSFGDLFLQTWGPSAAQPGAPKGYPPGSKLNQGMTVPKPAGA